MLNNPSINSHSVLGVPSIGMWGYRNGPQHGNLVVLASSPFFIPSVLHYNHELITIHRVIIKLLNNLSAEELGMSNAD